MDWKARCEERKNRQESEIPSEWRVDVIPGQLDVLDVPRTCGLLSDRELRITETTDIELMLRRLASGSWSSVEVTTAFYKRAIIAHQLTNCLTEIFIERAIERARYVDDYLAQTGKTLGPLHGLPISVKDQFSMKGLETIMGYVSWIGKYSEHDSVLIEILYESGAVPFVRTNVPQTLMWGETFNHVFGRTTNPYNTSLTPGGSSGGEGALLAMKGSPLGIGTDIGGSVRIPGAFCGLYALRPSYDRFPYYGALNTAAGEMSIFSVLGPMALSTAALRVFARAVLAAEPWERDPLVVRRPWDEQSYALEGHGGRGARLCFAIMWDNGIIKPLPPIKRALKMTKAALEAAGHKVINWRPHRHLDIYKNAETIIVADSMEDVYQECKKSGEPVITSMKPNESEEWGEFHPVSIPFASMLIGKYRDRSAFEMKEFIKDKKLLRKSHLDHWQATVSQTGTGRPVDAIIMPVAAYPAPPHGLNTDCFYTTLANAMDYVSAAFPVTSVDQDLDKPEEQHEFYNHEDRAVYDIYKPEIYTNAPVGLQIMGKTHEEEAILAMLEVVDDCLKAYRAGQAPSI